MAVAEDKANSDGSSLVLDEGNFYDLVIDLETNKVMGDKPWFIKFYSPWCHHCKQMKPTWEELHTKNKDSLNVASVDCTTFNGIKLCNSFTI